jgi:hypothetical protein
MLLPILRVQLFEIDVKEFHTEGKNRNPFGTHADCATTLFLLNSSRLRRAASEEKGEERERERESQDENKKRQVP